jgi:SAM-dependent methyltransferase
MKALIEWFRSGSDPWMNFGDAIASYQAGHPRTVFLKSLQRNSSLLDLGAGNGSLLDFKTWPQPSRTDIRMYAYAMEKGEKFDAYEGFEVGEWPIQKPTFGGQAFDAIVCAHFIEHITEPMELVSWCASRLKPNGRLYIEWPTEASKLLPPRQLFLEHEIPISISNFDDDATHKSIPSRPQLVVVAERNGLTVDSQGTISNPFFEQEVLAQHKHGNADSFSLQCALWSKVKWAQYVAATRA